MLPFRKSLPSNVTPLRPPVNYVGNLPGTEILSKELPSGWVLNRHSFSYLTVSMPTQEEITTVTDFLSEAYGLKLLHAQVSLDSGRSWTADNAKFRVDISLYGPK